MVVIETGCNGKEVHAGYYLLVPRRGPVLSRINGNGGGGAWWPCGRVGSGKSSLLAAILGRWRRGAAAQQTPG
uniref:ABC transporter domain-containing protein n=1 Tax=Knipowitschia caucasica TaxID=637954 RepID=A0AAV2MJ53_KNICA